MASRTNFVKVSNLPPGYNNGQQLFSTFSSCGQIQDITAVDQSTIIVSYAMRWENMFSCDHLTSVSNNKMQFSHNLLPSIVN